jgi:hypothetical protein
MSYSPRKISAYLWIIFSLMLIVMARLGDAWNAWVYSNIKSHAPIPFFEYPQIIITSVFIGFLLAQIFMTFFRFKIRKILAELGLPFTPGNIKSVHVREIPVKMSLEDTLAYCRKILDYFREPQILEDKPLEGKLTAEIRNSVKVTSFQIVSFTIKSEGLHSTTVTVKCYPHSNLILNDYGKSLELVEIISSILKGEIELTGHIENYPRKRIPAYDDLDIANYFIPLLIAITGIIYSAYVEYSKWKAIS